MDHIRNVLRLKNSQNHLCLYKGWLRPFHVWNLSSFRMCSANLAKGLRNTVTEKGQSDVMSITEKRDFFSSVGFRASVTGWKKSQAELFPPYFWSKNALALSRGSQPTGREKFWTCRCRFLVNFFLIWMTELIGIGRNSKTT